MDKKTKIVSMDIETRCNQPDCAGLTCKHALSPFTSEFVSAGFYCGGPDGFSLVIRSLSELKEYMRDNREYRLLGQNFKFDLNYLYHKGLEIPFDSWVHDTQVLAGTVLTKVPTVYLEAYEEKRKELNKERPVGKRFRPRGGYSLKVLAPFFLNVEPFWESEGVETDEYVLKDCKYAYELGELFTKMLVQEGTATFYTEKFMPWTKTLAMMERTGITIDMAGIDKAEAISLQSTEKLQLKLNDAWSVAHKAWHKKNVTELQDKYIEMRQTAEGKWIDKGKVLDDKKKLQLLTRYNKLYESAVDKLEKHFSLDSPKDMLWLLRDYLGYDVTDVTGDDSTGKAVIETLSTQDPLLKEYLDYRAEYKLQSTYYKKYRKIHQDNIIRCSFNPTGAKTGRLSSSGPNMQQVPSALHKYFIARQGKLIDTHDMSAIEAMLIAYYTEDPILLDIIFSGIDFHGHNAKLYFPEITCGANLVKAEFPKERKFAKTLGYALFYGAGKNRIQHTSQIHGYDWPLEKCKEVLDRFKAEYWQVFAFKADLDGRATREPIMNMFGRKRSYISTPEDIHMKNFNSLVQGSASDMVVHSAYQIQQTGWIQPLLLVHDEIVSEFPEERKDEAIELIPKIMTSYELPTVRGNIPLKVEGGIKKYWEKE